MKSGGFVIGVILALMMAGIFYKKQKEARPKVNKETPQSLKKQIEEDIKKSQKDRKVED
jgi:hypothetical protein